NNFRTVFFRQLPSRCNRPQTASGCSRSPLTTTLLRTIRRADALHPSLLFSKFIFHFERFAILTKFSKR
ncbi:MAG TPA: hypothetical protein VGB76_14985, partial [Pyrinomonadaceae bacterium]